MKDALWLEPGYLEVTKEGQPEKQSASGAEGKEKGFVADVTEGIPGAGEHKQLTGKEPVTQWAMSESSSET